MEQQLRVIVHKQQIRGAMSLAVSGRTGNPRQGRLCVFRERLHWSETWPSLICQYVIVVVTVTVVIRGRCANLVHMLSRDYVVR